MNINLFKFQSHFYTIFNSDVLKKCIVLFGFEFSSVQLKNDFKLDYTPDKYLTKNLLSLVYKTSLIYCLKIKKIFYISKLPFYLLKFNGFNLKSNNYFKLSFIFTIKIQFTLSRCYLKLLDLYKNFFDLDCNFNLLVLNFSGKKNFLFINEFLNQNKNILKKIFFINFYIKIYKKDSKIKNFDIK
ncbi:hypothetical protein E5P55_01080 [Candidatus Pinguicoccus supinus]|uniref:Uncharacterized protein n=1 Tax=Candidatus Pinguicoccus supinus TaxID=2529394 RepID=A0A7T0BRZ5_9BACT|nr:hypothetical protein E5P55_01080 [Candidatus Pinguicoccus supinus]